ncbi:ATP-NAD kinase-like domain-containing protein [Mucor mucedo]|uniref:ATP-NAD kinase-like domain-containing protein n=1 Tax=Mucor mucedo TaxID=29922 RepID=UPI00222015A9|nr:ATP-NAD kinase-like domain-containing protein [Mucor mucedo]KAI7896486.1 ATP-NAD kinase-like domain-containing protein [Mucor mucedo]
MVYSTPAKNNITNEGVQLLVDNSQLMVEHKNSSTAATKEIFDLEFIYGIEYDDEILSVHLIEKEKEDTKVIGEAQKTLTNIRPQDVKWHLRTLQFISVTGDDKQSLSEFAIQFQQEALPHRDELPKTRVIVVLNPTSGLQLATNYWKTVVQPMLVMGGFSESNITKIITESDGKTRALVQGVAQELTDHAIIISMGGDGTLHEIVNGLLDASPHCRIRLGVIPVGSGNAFALGLNIDNVEQATLRIIQGKKEEPFYMMDVKLGHSHATANWQENIEYDETKQPTRLLVVMSWGFHAQIVSKSRYLRYFMGNKRFSLVAMFLLKFLQQYPGELVLKNAMKYNAELERFIDMEQDVVLNDEFTYFIASKQHSLEKGFKIAPFSSPLKKEMDVVLLRRVDAETLTTASMGAFQGGIHVNSEPVEYYKTTDLLLRVKHKAELCLDGEIHDLPAKGVVHLKVIGSSSTESNFTVFV